jgi:hypothetical protein
MAMHAKLPGRDDDEPLDDDEADELPDDEELPDEDPDDA